MEKTIVILGLNNALVEFNERSFSWAPLDVLDIKHRAYELVNALKEEKKKNPNLDFVVWSGLEQEMVDFFIKATASEELFSRNLKISFIEDDISRKIYNSFWHKILRYKSKKVFTLKGYDRVILADAMGSQAFDFIALKLWLKLKKKDQRLAEYKEKMFAYLYIGRDMSVIEKDLLKLIRKEKKGVFIY